MLILYQDATRNILTQWAMITHLCKSVIYSHSELEKYALAVGEWDILEEMQPILQVHNYFFQLDFIF